jgi:ABC-type antimicrobial peptide transport system permease subunit
MAIGAQAGDIARSVTADVFLMVLAGAAAGLGLGMLSVRYIAALLYQVRPSDPTMLALPAVIILGAALIAALPAVFHAVRVDPMATLRAD